MYLLVLFLPLLSAVISGLFGRKMGGRGVAVLASVCMVFSSLLSLGVFYEVVLNGR